MSAAPEPAGPEAARPGAARPEDNGAGRFGTDRGRPGPGGPGGHPAASVLAPYLPRSALAWLAEDPGRLHRRVGGTLAFVDVSGFTALTERLAARGRVGAEEITDVIGSVFGELLAVADSWGADLLKWGGDAVLLYFDGDDSALRATHAATVMVAAVGRLGRFRTSAGRVALGVSAGVHSGDFDLYLLGDRHRELIVTGPAASLTAAMEAAAGAGEVVVSPATAAALDPGSLGGPRGGGLIVTAVPAPTRRPAGPVPPPAGLDVGVLMPADRRAHLLAGGEQAEHRQATVAFVEFRGIDALSAAGGGDAVAACLGPVVSAAEEAAERFGVNFHETDIGPDGGKIVLLGGVPRHRGADAERALRAVHHIVSTHPASSPLRLRAGVNTGRVFVFAHEFAAARRRVFAVTGDTVNLAARVMGRADPGQVVATEAALIRAGNPFETEPLAPFAVKGRTAPVIAAALRAPRPGTAGGGGDAGPFVGRSDELAELLARAEAAAGGAGGAIDVVGPAGIGKSRLVSEAIDRWSLTTLRVACEEYGATSPYRPFRRVFRRILGFTDDSAPEAVAAGLTAVVAAIAPELGGLLPLLADVVDVVVTPTAEVDDLEPRFRRATLERAVTTLLRAYLTEPSALVFENADALDEASASLLARIAGEAPELPLLVVLTSARDQGAERPAALAAVAVLPLAPLGADDAAALAGADGPSALPPAAVAAIVARAEGNPLFLRELARGARDAGGVDELPESLEPLLVAGIDRLAPTDRRVLRAASVIGTHVEPAVLDRVLGGSVDLDAALWSRLAPFMVPTASGWRFVHGLLRDAAYEGLAFRRRRELHEAAALAVEATAADAADLLSLHWFLAERYEPAWRHARTAGDRARALWANADAAVFYDRAVRAARHLALPAAEVAGVAEALGDALELSAGYERAGRAYARARRLGSDPADRARLLRKTGVLHERRGRYAAALACYARGRRLLAAADPVADQRSAALTERAELDLASAGIRFRQGRYRDAARFADAAAAGATAAGHDPGLAHALYLRHVVSVYLGDPDDDPALRALAIYEGLGDHVGVGNVVNNLGIGAYYRGRWAEAGEYYQRSRAARLRAGDVTGAATEENNLAEILSDQGHLDEARPMFTAVRAIWLAAGYRVGAALAVSNLGRLEARAGDTAAATVLLREALGEFRAIGAAVFVAETQLRLAEAALLGGDLDAAGDALAGLLPDVAGRPGLEAVEVAALRLAGTVAGLGPGHGDGPWAGALDEAVARAGASENPYEQAMALATRAVLAGSAARRRADRAAATAVFARLGVERAVITWSAPGAGGPLLAVGAPAVAGRSGTT